MPFEADQCRANSERQSCHAISKAHANRRNQKQSQQLRHRIFQRDAAVVTVFVTTKWRANPEGTEIVRFPESASREHVVYKNSSRYPLDAPTAIKEQTKS
ncbi:MAG: hypothetical protein HY961_00950 [Ignavibacteriae bacterium]|nr:hypothetical protein [Ignavibacteriota bacterium]